MTPLETLMRAHIANVGPLSVAEYMSLCLSHPEHGYYMAREPFGREGDFITAPEISQMFGELLGLWAVATWQALGSPERFALLELGPGRGTLMADALRAASGHEAFLKAMTVHLVEMSPALIAKQEDTLKPAAATPLWHATLEQSLSASEGPVIVIANEFLDALPIHQFARSESGWHERGIGLADDKLAFILNEAPADDDVQAYCEQLSNEPGAIVEISPAIVQIIGELATALTARGGAALIIDYGYEVSAAGETLQAVKGHDYCHVFDTPGDADITAHVNLGAVAGAAMRAGASIHGPLAQGDFLGRVGIHQRAERLAETNPLHRESVAAAHARLTLPNQMGSLFKVLAIAQPGLVPPAFDGPASDPASGLASDPVSE